ncbi:hypothetical protein F5Y09DRAFT_350075 [Xylaria sp. FL1042]|nr:hypothetical protein F5Y09DRAFT_350075 [Xylaria sp. FL1042]
MSASFRAGLHLRCVCHLCRSSPATQRKPTARHISWMPFEQPDPSLYPPPPSLQPKRPVTTEAASSDGASVSQTATIGKLGAAPSSTARAQEDPASSKPVPTSVPASAMRTGPTPLSQIQKRSFSSTTTTTTSTVAAAIAEHRKRLGEEEEEQTNPATVSPTEEGDANNMPTVHLRLLGHPATWPATRGGGGGGEEQTTPGVASPTKEGDANSFPTLHLRMPGHPATWRAS